MNPCVIPKVPIDIQGDSRWMSQVNKLLLIILIIKIY